MEKRGIPEVTVLELQDTLYLALHAPLVWGRAKG